VEEEHLDAARAHQVDERVELLPRPAHPDDVVEQQLVAVRRREPLVRQVGPVDDDAVQGPDLGGDAEGGVRGDAGEPVGAAAVEAENELREPARWGTTFTVIQSWGRMVT